MRAKTTAVDVLRKIKEHIRHGTYILREHAIEMQERRHISLPDILRILEYGRHENEKDVFDVKNQRWKHAVRGRTISGIDLRVIVAFHERMAIITVIRID